MEKEKTIGDYAEEWWKLEGNKVPESNTEEWKIMYELWHRFAFVDFRLDEDDYKYDSSGKLKTFDKKTKSGHRYRFEN